MGYETEKTVVKMTKEQFVINGLLSVVNDLTTILNNEDNYINSDLRMKVQYLEQKKDDLIRLNEVLK